MCEPPPIIAIDGTAGAGKGTLAKRLSARLHFGHLDTGKLYRAVAYLCIVYNVDTTDTPAIVALVDKITDNILQNPELATNDVGNIASATISRIQSVRDALFSYQRRFPEKCSQNGLNGAVVDGRDIGSVIFSNAPIKFCVTADVNMRAERRYAEYKQSDNPLDFATILADLKSRDYRDMTAKVGRLVQTKDSILLDSSHLNPDEILTAALSHIKKVYKFV